MNFLNTRLILGQVMMITLISGCKTTGHIARVDQDRRRIEIQSQSDKSSVMYALQQKGALNQAASRLENNLKQEPANLRTMLNLSQIYLAQGRLKEAQDLCRQALKIDLKNQVARLILAQIYFREENYDMADIILNGLDEETAKDSQVINMRAMIALNQDRPSLALALFQDALRANPGDVAVRMNLGVLYVQFRQLDQAAVQFERILKLMPQHPDAKLHLAIVNSARKEFNQAQRLYNEVLSLDSKNPVAVYNFAVLEERRGRYDEAIKHLRTYLDTDFARSQSNQEVFAMIDRIRLQKEAEGRAMSDRDIKDLASRAKQGPSLGEKSALRAKEAPKDDQAIPEQPTDLKEAAPARSTGAGNRRYRSDEDEIEALERALR